MSTNTVLRMLRHYLNLSMQEVADTAGVSYLTVLRAEQGMPLNPYSRHRLCLFYNKTCEELGLVARGRRTKGEFSTTMARKYQAECSDISAESG